jgi:hypothetical protein
VEFDVFIEGRNCRRTLPAAISIVNLFTARIRTQKFKLLNARTILYCTNVMSLMKEERIMVKSVVMSGEILMYRNDSYKLLAKPLML